MPLQIIRQDITKMECDAIVNPTNEELIPDGGLDLRIHNVAGEQLLNACKSIGHIEVGQAVITPAYKLLSKHVIHTAGPVWSGGDKNEEHKLRVCYKNALNLASVNNCESVAFPLISSGAYGYPKDEVLKIAIETISDFLMTSDMMVYLVVFDKTSYQLSSRLFTSIDSYIDDNYVSKSHLRRNREYRRLSKAAGYEKAFGSMLDMAPCASKGCPYEEVTECKLKSLSIDDYIKLDESFAVRLLKLIDLKGMSDIECYKKANVSKQTWYKIMNDKHYKPNKKTVISFAVALKLSLDETQNLLKTVGFVLSNSSLFDVIIMYCLENEVHDVFEIDSILFRYDQETLYSKL